MKDIRAIFKEINGFFLTSGVFTYTLGTVLALQAGQAWNATSYFLGLLIFFGFYLLERTYAYLSRSKINVFSTLQRSRRLRSPELVIFLFFLFAALLLCVYFISLTGGLRSPNWVWFLLLAVGILMNVSKNLNQWNMPYRWMTDGIIISPILLFWGASLAKLDSTPILFFLSLPLLLFYLASQTSLQFETYEEDLKKGQQALLVSIGWERGMTLHHILVALGYLGLGFYLYISGAWVIAWPVLLMMSVSLFEIWQLQRIAGGMRPNWGLLKATAITQYLGIVYILLFAFLTH
jgi:1,4-dihydroxy-2-naphthoate octaprenyltransferase